MRASLSSKIKFVVHVLGILIVGILVGCQDDLIQTETVDEYEVGTLKRATLNNFMVISKSETLPDGLINQLANYGEVVRTIPEIGVVVINANVANFEAKVSGLSSVQSVVPDFKVKWQHPVNVLPMVNPPSIGDDEPFFPLQWGLDAIDAPEAWNSGVTGEGAKVFILDSGIDAEHPDLAPNLNSALCASFVPGEDWNIQPGEYFSHGSHVAGIVAAADGGGVVIGVAPHAEIVAVKVLSEFDGSGQFSWVNEGIVYAANNDADVINMSLGATFARNGFYLDDEGNFQKEPAIYTQSLILAMQRAVNYAYQKRAVIVCSAGNDGSNFDHNAYMLSIPAELQNVIAVSATAPDYWYNDVINGITPDLDVAASYIDYGRSLVDLAAPGGDYDFYDLEGWYYDMVLSAGSESYWFASGTSMSSAHVSGVAALIISKSGGDITNKEVEKQLFKTADNIDTNGASLFLGKGRVSAYRAVTE